MKYRVIALLLTFFITQIMGAKNFEIKEDSDSFSIEAENP